MEKISSRYRWLNTVSLLLVLPTTYFIVISLLKYSLGIGGPFDAVQPFLERMGIQESLGWNINLLILFGPVLALLFSALQILHIDWHFSKEQFDFRITVQKKWLPFSIALLSVLVLATLFIYMIGENSCA